MVKLGRYDRGKRLTRARRARQGCVGDDSSHAEQAGDEGYRLVRRRVRRIHREQAVAALPGDGLLELEIRR